VNDAVAFRRRVWFGVIVVTAFVLLGIAALIPNGTPPSIHLDSASADETLPPASSTVRAAPSTTEAPVVSAPTTTSAPATTTTTASSTPKRAAATATAATTPPATAVKATPPPVVTPVIAPTPPPDALAFLACVRQRESHGNYRAVSSSGTYRGAYQFSQSSWDSAARHAGRLDLVGVPPDQASPADQDALALDLYKWQGSKPWGGACS